MSSKNLLSMALTAAAAFLFSVAHADDAQAGVFELAKDNDLVHYYPIGGIDSFLLVSLMIS